MLLKESSIELCENMYALSMNYLRTRENMELKELLVRLNELETNIRKCNDETKLNKYIIQLNILCDKIEGIINE